MKREKIERKKVQKVQKVQSTEYRVQYRVVNWMLFFCSGEGECGDM